MFDPTDKQLAALANMARFAGAGEPPSSFADRAAFQSYWDGLSARCDRIARGRERDRAQGRNPAQRGARRDAAKQRHYGDLATLLGYARGYARRYAPAWAKLREKLLSKCGDPAVVEQALAQLGEFDRDGELALALVERWRGQGRSRREMAAKLRQRRFAPAAIDHALEAVSDADGSVLDPEAVRSAAARLQRSGKSRRAIRQRLMGEAADAAIVDDALAEAVADDAEQANLQRQLDRLRRKDLDRQALIKRLAGRGFSYPAILRALDEC